MGNTVFIKGQNIAANISSVSSQAGPRWPAPLAGASNAGQFSPGISGTPADYVYSGTATGDGAGGGTTVVDSVLAVFGDNWFIGATLAITSGACSGESKTVTDFAQATGTLTTAAFTAQIVTGVTFTLTLAYSSRDFRLELIAAGDAGNATFKFSHDGGTNWFGRKSPTATGWIAPVLISAGLSTDKATGIIQAANGDVVAVYVSSATMARRSTDGGLTWGAEITIFGSHYRPKLCLLSSGRLWCFARDDAAYSDDNGLTWTNPALTGFGTLLLSGAVELANGNLVACADNGSAVYARISTDGGFSWSDEITVAADANEQVSSVIEVLANGDVVIAYSTDQDSVGDYEIKCKISSDGGSTWGAAVDVMNILSDLTYPALVKDVNGDMLCVACESGGGMDIVNSYDNGAGWANRSNIYGGAVSWKCACLALVNGQIFAGYEDASQNFYFVRAGFWETYAANAAPVAVNLTPQTLACGASIIWNGGAGVIGDTFSLEAAYDYGAENLFTDSPSSPWRTATDNAAHTVVFDAGANARFYIDGAAIFGSNVRKLKIQMHASDSWGAPSVSEEIDLSIATGAIDAVAANWIKDTSLLAAYVDHELAGKYFTATSGTDSGLVWKIADNQGDYIILDTTTAHNLANSDTFAIYGTQKAKTFTGGVYRFVRVLIEAQQTAENYYSVGYLAAGLAVTLAHCFSTGWGLTDVLDRELMRTPSGGLIAVSGPAKKRRIWTLVWPASTTARAQIRALADIVLGGNLAFIPNSSALADVALVKITGDLQSTQAVGSAFNFGPVILEEVL
ncbi:MAG: exo-alpha-sialidase [Deltaproteobacteria bacterium]|nr:exo-alpha-sialidase [Deltaproteobacteria bacterium]